MNDLENYPFENEQQNKLYNWVNYTAMIKYNRFSGTSSKNE